MRMWKCRAEQHARVGVDQSSESGLSVRPSFDLRPSPFIFFYAALDLCLSAAPASLRAKDPNNGKRRR